MLIHFRKMRIPPPRLLSLIWVFVSKTVPPAMEQPTKRKAITLSKIRFILPLFITTLLSFFKLTFLLYLKPFNLPSDFTKFLKNLMAEIGRYAREPAIAPSEQAHTSCLRTPARISPTAKTPLTDVSIFSSVKI